MGVWRRLRDLDAVIVAGGRDLQLDDASVQAWWDGLPPAHRVAVWEAARSHPPEDRVAVHAWVAILTARSARERQWTPWFGVAGLLTMAGLVLLAIDRGGLATLPFVGGLVGVALGRLHSQVALERRRADLLGWLVTTLRDG